MPSSHTPHVEPTPLDPARPAIAISERLARALAHPLRVQVLSVLNEREAISPKEFKDTTDAPAPISTVAKQFRVLEELRCIEMTGTRKSGRNIERLFQATQRPAFDRQAWELLPLPTKRGLSARIFATYMDRIAQAVEAETFDARNGRRFSWLHRTYDEIAWAKMIDATEAVLWWSLDAQLESRRRLSRTGETPIPLVSSLSTIEAAPATDGSESLAQLQCAPFFLEKGGEMFFNPNLAAGFTHDLRIRIFAALSRWPLSPRDFHERFGRRLGVTLSNVAQHFRRLEMLGCIELLDIRKGRHKSRERVFRAIPHSLFDGSAWIRMPTSIRAEVTSLTATTFVRAYADAFAANTFDKRAESHFSWVGMKVDEQGWNELTTAQAVLLRYSRVLAEESRERLDRSPGQGIPVLIGVGCFEAPPEMEVTPDTTLRKLAEDYRPDRRALRQVLAKIEKACDDGRDERMGYELWVN